MTPSGTRRGRGVAGHDQADDTATPAGAVPLQIDPDEGVARKQQRPLLDLAAAGKAVGSKSRGVDPVAAELEMMASPGRHGCFRAARRTNTAWKPPPACGKQDAGIGWRRLMGTAERPLKLNGLGAFLLADYPYWLAHGGQSLSAA